MLKLSYTNTLKKCGWLSHQFPYKAAAEDGGWRGSMESFIWLSGNIFTGVYGGWKRHTGSAISRRFKSLHPICLKPGWEIISLLPSFPLFNSCFVICVYGKGLFLVSPLLILVFLPFEVVGGAYVFKEWNPYERVKPFPGRSLQESQGWGELDWLLWPEERNMDCQWQVGVARRRGLGPKWGSSLVA